MNVHRPNFRRASESFQVRFCRNGSVVGSLTLRPSNAGIGAAYGHCFSDAFFVDDDGFGAR